MRISKKHIQIFALAFVSICTIAVLLIRLAQCQMADDGDNLSLFNPVYMLANYGRMVYPVHGYFDCMVVHPPLHYMLIAIFYKINNNIVIARGLVYLLAYGVALFTVFRVKLPFNWKFAFIVALFGVTLTGMFYFGTRPSLCLSIYWFTGWLLIEAGRQNNWKASYLLWGSFLLGATSAMHYFAAFTGAGLLVYVALLWYNFNREFAIRKSAYVLFPASLVVGLYVILNIIPNLGDVRHAVSGAPGTGSIWDNMSRHMLYFNFLPPFFITLILMYPSPKTRYLALAALPVSLFVFFFVYQKWDYFFPEQFMMFFAITLLLCNFLKQYFIAMLVVFIATQTSDFSKANENTKLGSNLRHSSMDVARACSQTMWGSNAHIGSRMDIWYISGAAHWLNVLPDIYWKEDIDSNYLNHYLKQFDAIAENAAMSNFTSNLKHETLPVWYMQGKIKLGGFYFHSAHFSTNSLNMLFYVLPEKEVTVKGFSHEDNGKLYAYTASPGGNQMYVVFKSSKEEALAFMNTRKQMNVGSLALPNPEAGHTNQYDTDVKEMLTFGLISASEMNLLNSDVTLIDTIRVCESVVNIDILMHKMREIEKPIRFYKTFEDWKAGNAYYK